MRTLQLAVLYILIGITTILGIIGSSGSKEWKYRAAFLVFLFISVFVGLYVIGSDL